MKPDISIFFIMLSSMMVLDACTNGNKSGDSSLSDQDIPSLSYDSVRAKAYGADEYGMKKYVMAFLKRGPNRSRDSLTAAKLQKAHLENIQKMADQGKLVLAGPFFGDDDLRGIYIFDVPGLEQAEELTNSDPLIKSGGLIMEFREWYGPAGLKSVNEINQTLTKKNISEEF